MPKDDEQVEDTTVDETTTEQGSEPEVELDKPNNIEGDLVENPTLEEVDDPGTGNEEEAAEGTAEESQDGSEDTDGSSEDTETGSTEDNETVSEAELTAEPDEAGVYNPPAPDPGQFQPTGNYGFEVTIADGKTIKINTPDEADAFAERLDNEENLLTARQFVQFTRNVSKMDSGVSRELEQFETQKQAFEAQQAQEQVRNQQVSQWNNEINYLAAKGLIPEITPELNASNWTDPTVSEQAPVKERLAIFKWMEGENNNRRAAGIAEITSAVDAFRLMQADTQQQVAKEERQTEVSNRQAKGRMVSGNSAFIPENTQKDSIVGEGGSLNDLIHEFSASQ